MTHAQVEAALFVEELHPRAAGGQFGTKSKPAKTSPAAKTTPKRRQRRVIPAGQLGFDGVRGTGYGHKGGDKRVRALQEQLNRLGLTDLHGRKLAVDGKLGPLTTSAIKAAQLRLGMRPTGIIAPAFIDRLAATRVLPAAKHAPAKKASPRVRAAADLAEPDEDQDDEDEPDADEADEADEEPSGTESVEAASGAEPYGDVEYADPGYQPDGRKRYPLDSEEHCRAAWSYINQADNAGEYSADELARVKARVLAAGRKYGIEFDEDKRKVAAAELRGIELARPGMWKLSSGTQTFTEAHLHDAARYANRPGARPAHVKIGHVDPRFDGEPALGWVGNVRVEDRNGLALVGDITGMPDWLAASAKDAWPDRSVEGWLDFTADDGEKYGFVVEALALLGVTPPGMSSIQSLRDLPKAVGIAAASGVRVVASMSPAPMAAEEGAGPMDPAITRTALGLSADAPDDEVASAMEAAAAALRGDPAPAPVQASLFGEEPVKPKAPAKPDVAQGSWMRVEASAWAAAQERIQALEAQAQRQREGERDQVIAEAVKAGKFAPARREHWVRLWNADPEGTREVIDGLARNVMPVTASGYAGGVDDEDLDREFASLFPPVVKEARRG